MSQGEITVAVACAPDYDPGGVRRAVRTALSALPGWAEALRPGRRILLKPNVVNPQAPERAVCTHPQVLRAVAEVCHEAGCAVLVCDQPTYALRTSAETVFGACGYREALRGLRVEWRLAAEAGYREFPVPRPYQAPVAYLSRFLDEVDAVVNLPKLKTHIQTRLTAAVKNTFGLVAPRQRMDLHALGNGRLLSEALVDMFGAHPPQWSLLDAVVAMEGPGPTRGRPRAMGVILASADAVALDAVAAHAAGLRPREVRTTLAAAEAGYGVADLAALRLVGEALPLLRPSLRRAPSLAARLPRALAGLGRRLLYLRPAVDRRACVACGQCAAVCPAGCIRIEEVAVLDRRRCLECFCCMEACPQDAIEVQRSPLARLL